MRLKDSSLEMCTGGTRFTVGGPMIFSLEIRAVQGFFPWKSGGVLGFLPWKSGGGVGFFPRRVMRRVIFDTHNSFNMKCGRLKRCSNALKIDIVCILGVFSRFLALCCFQTWYASLLGVVIVVFRILGWGAGFFPGF